MERGKLFSDNKVIFVGASMGILFWILETALHAFLFREDDFVNLLFAPARHEFWMRLIVLLVIFVFSIYAKTATHKNRKTEDATLQLMREIESRIKAEYLLRESENMYRAIFETTGTATVIIEEDTTISMSNVKFGELSGYSQKDIDGRKKWSEFVAEEDLERLKEYHRNRRAETRSAPASYEFTFVDRTGSRKDVFVTVGMIPDTKKSIASLVDITARKSHENLLKESEKKHRELNSELSVLYKVSSVISQTIELDKLLNNILSTITGIEIFGVERKGGIFIIEGDRLNLVSHLGHEEKFLSYHNRLKIGECLCGIAAKTGEIIISKDSEHDPNHTIRYEEMTRHGHVIIPLKAKDKTVGVLYLYTPAGTEIDASSINLLISISNQLAIAVENALLYEKTKVLSLYDPLTGLANRRHLEVVFEKEFAEAKRYGSPLSVAMIDVDNFKKYNDSFGHSEGDNLLLKVAEILRKETRETDLAVRYGGEEFLVMFTGTNIYDAQDVAERIRKAVESGTGNTISAGLSTYHGAIQRKEEIIDDSDKALYQAKRTGKNRVVVLR